MRQPTTRTPIRNAGALAIILARAGSKGCPGKNWALLNAKPCIAWSIEDALASTRVARVVVSTDGDELAAVARGYGVEVVHRPPELASDTARIDDAARHAVRTIGWHEGPVVVLYANVPLRPDDLIDRAVDLLTSSSADSVQSYTRVGKFHPWWMVRLDERTGEVRPWEGEVMNNGVYRRQDLPPALIPDGGVIAVTRPALMLELDGVAEGPHAFLGRESMRRGVVNPEGSVVDIDTMIDLLFARTLVENGHHHEPAHRCA